MASTIYLAGRDPVSLDGGGEPVRRLASRLWQRAPAADAPVPAPLVSISISLESERPEGDPERDGAWEVDDASGRVRLDAAGISLCVRASKAGSDAVARVSARLVERRPDLAARLLLETPVTLAKMTRMQLLHAGSLVGPRGAVVLRGASGAGKSTLVGAGWKAGLGVLGDESVLVRRDDPDALEATLRDLALPLDSARLLGLTERTELAFSGGEEKRRVPLFGSARPSDRTARRVATFLLGPREPGPARLVPLDPAEFRTLFEAGGIPQEKAFGADPAAVAEAWSRGSWRLDGTVDLVGSLGLVTHVTGRP